MYQSAHTNHAGVETTLSTLITEPSGPTMIVIGVSQTFRRNQVSLDDTMSEPPTIHSYHATAAVYRWGNIDSKSPLSSLDGCPEVRRGGIGRSGKDGIRMNPPGNIGCNGPQITGRGDFELFDLYTGMSDFSNVAVLSISENSGRDSLFKNTGYGIIFEVEIYGHKNYEIQIQTNHAASNHVESNHSNSIYSDLIPANSTNIETENQHDSDDSCSLHKILPWGSHDL